MCGLAGVMVAAGPASAEVRAALERMRALQHHRGPDDAGTRWTADERVGLANCRLSVRDLTQAGHMPMCAADDVCITYNGEIYNADELRAELRRSGHQFMSHSDTEVLLRGYLQWQEKVLLRLRGMFAFALYDARSQTLLLARDPLGIKPLCYSRTLPFCFASELRALTGSGLVSREIDETALGAYLQLGSIPAPLTIYRDVAALPPAHFGIVHVDGSGIDVRRYWHAQAPLNPATLPDVMTALQEAVASHLVSDVPVGAFLSGGLDSSTVVALAARASAEPLQTCSIAFASRAHDESPIARAVARELGTVHHERLVTEDDFLAGIDGFMTAMDQPSIDGFNTYFVAETASRIGWKVALSGLGGDELFGGYPSFRGVPRLMRALGSARVLAGGGVGHAIGAVTRSDRWRKVAEATRQPVSAASAFLVFRGLFTRSEAAALLKSSQQFDAVDHVAGRAGAVGGSVQEWVARAELGTYTTSQLLRDSDVMSMAHSLELRVPLLDTRLLETVNALPSAVRFPRGRPKALLREIMKDRLPRVVLERRARQGFSFPMQQWLTQDRAQDLWTFNAPIMRHFEAAALAEVQQRFRAGYTHWSRAWALIALNEWSRRSAHV
jgi:asparagine synthase (glutamine-hydrolysing)